ncbi:hypothetical protein AB0H83_14455 [Dactylosporangium sp. NPDC050688]|uniref:hypothetical protein n=1 Tax=Dactylosporangium sp. NPDC050688 TaxID=3157217 RepID=UPI0033D7BAAD
MQGFANSASSRWAANNRRRPGPDWPRRGHITGRIGFFSAARWSVEKIGLTLFDLVLANLVPTTPICCSRLMTPRIAVGVRKSTAPGGSGTRCGGKSCGRFRHGTA